MKRFNWNSFPQIAHAIPRAMELTDHGQVVMRHAEMQRERIERVRKRAAEGTNVIRRGTLRAVRN